MTGQRAEDIKRKIQDLADVFSASDPAAAYELMLDLFDPDVVVHEPESLPYGGTYRGRDEFLAAMGGMMATHVDGKRVRLDKVVADDEQVVARWRYPWRLDESHEFVEVEVNEWLTFRNGKIVEARPFYWDTAQLMADKTSA
jgi:ketosteroid isomerase-like protein